MNYLLIFKKAFSLTWKNRYLWWFGFFASAVNIGGVNFMADDSKKNPQDAQKIVEYFSQNWQWIIWVAAALLILWLVFLVLGIVSRGALIVSAHKISQGELFNLRLGIKAGREYFWKLFLISISIGMAALMLILATFIPVALLFMSSRPISGIIMAVLAVVIIIPIFILFSFLRIFGQMYVTLGSLNFWPALENAYNLFRHNMSSSIVMGLLFIPLNIFIFLLILTLLIPLAIVFFPIGLVAFLIVGKIGALTVGIFGAIIFFALVLIIKSAYEVFAQSAWVFFFEQIAKPKITETIVEEKKETIEAPKALPAIEARKE